MKNLYAITHVNKDGLRQLTFANQGRNHYATFHEANAAMLLYAPSLREKVLGDLADTLEVRPVRCWPHGDAVGIYFEA